MGVRHSGRGFPYRTIQSGRPDGRCSRAIILRTVLFAAAILGGVGILPGAMVGGILLGIVETMVSAYISTGYRDAISFTILIVVLLFMPNGMFGKKAINKV